MSPVPPPYVAAFASPFPLSEEPFFELPLSEEAFFDSPFAEVPLFLSAAAAFLYDSLR